MDEVFFRIGGTYTVLIGNYTNISIIKDFLTLYATDFSGVGEYIFYTNISNISIKVSTTLLKSIIKLFARVGILFRFIDYRKGKTFKETLQVDVLLREYQFDALNTIINNTITDSYGQTISYIYGIVYAAPNYGKTLVIAKLASYNVKLLIIVPDAKVLKAHKTFLSEIGVTCGYITQKRVKIARVTLALPQSLVNRINDGTISTDQIKYFDGLIYDEAHKYLSNSLYDTLNRFNFCIRLAFTGTPTSADHIRNKLIVAFCGSILYTHTFEDVYKLGSSKKISVSMRLFTNKLMCDSLKDEKAYLLSSDYVEFIISIIRECNEKTIVSFINKNFGTALREYLDAVKIPYLFIDGGTKKPENVVEEFAKTTNISILLGSKSLEAGLNMPYVSRVIFAQAEKDTKSVKQIIGRGTRESDITVLKVVDIMFTTDTFKLHSLIRLELYKNEGFDIDIKYDKKNIHL